jgi:hypothetical protein
MEKIIATLESCVVAEGWHESWQSGPMPKLAAEVMAYFRARAGGAPENAAEEAKVSAFVAKLRAIVGLDFQRRSWRHDLQSRRQFAPSGHSIEEDGAPAANRCSRD